MTDTWDKARKKSLEDAQMISMSILVKTWTFRKGFQWGMFMVLELQDNATWMLLNQRAWSNYSFTCYSISNIKKLENCWMSQPAFMHLDIMNNVKTATIIKTQKHPNEDWILNPKWNFLLPLTYANRLNLFKRICNPKMKINNDQNRMSFILPYNTKDEFLKIICLLFSL